MIDYVQAALSPLQSSTIAIHVCRRIRSKYDGHTSLQPMGLLLCESQSSSCFQGSQLQDRNALVFGIAFHQAGASILSSHSISPHHFPAFLLFEDAHSSPNAMLLTECFTRCLDNEEALEGSDPVLQSTLSPAASSSYLASRTSGSTCLSV